MNLGFSGELIFLAFLGLLLFGPRKLPEMARTAGRFIAELKRASKELQGKFEQEVGTLEFEDPTKNLFGSLADGLKALNSVRDPVKAVVALAEPEKIKEQLSGPSFLDNMSEYLNQTRSPAQVDNSASPVEPAVAEMNNGPTTTEKISIPAGNSAA